MDAGGIGESGGQCYKIYGERLGARERYGIMMYESKAKVRADFRQFQGMFAVMGGTLCAMLQAVGMTGRQLKAMLIWERRLFRPSIVERQKEF